MIAILRQFFNARIQRPVQRTGQLKRVITALAGFWWRGFLPCGKALRDEIEALERVRDRWRSR
ncbi:hypothetical protein HA050_01575 [Iodobacter sp. HSC-16F04]|uniref:Group II intron maturase-specific domain-containing protein n=1 Tax=Iodobacter violaceini TaxID=3044271 RepID=A0ABX0KRZ7_9NEIS|nr:hypothetical protein [Iodobacter violacea]NHQ84809.1 hypothetical protein [Iodobacter violacea]